MMNITDFQIKIFETLLEEFGRKIGDYDDDGTFIGVRDERKKLKRKKKGHDD